MKWWLVEKYMSNFCENIIFFMTKLLPALSQLNNITALTNRKKIKCKLCEILENHTRNTEIHKLFKCHGVVTF